jgi:hypothetical protein
MNRPGVLRSLPRADEGDLMDHQQPPVAKPRSRIRLIVQALFSGSSVASVGRSGSSG